MSNGKDKKVAGADKCWWVRTETVIALLKKNIQMIIWDFIKKYIIEPKDGEWKENASKDEVAERIDAILAEKINKIDLI